MLLTLLLSCADPYPGACNAYVRLYCDTCELEDYEKPLCKCIQKGKLTASDFPDSDLSDDDAQLQCDEEKAFVQYPDPDSEAECKQSLALMQKYDKDACDFAGVP